MHKIMEGLHKDHKNLAKVLKIMELQLDRIAKGDDAALGLMSDASNYIQSYPDIIHHPKEDKIFEVLKGHSNELSDAVETLELQHESLPASTLKFQTMLDAVINGLSVINRDELVEKIEKFIELEWEHMNLEESQVFPLIEKTLSSEDWDALEAQIDANNDPLFSDIVEQNFENLYQCINSQAA